MNFHLVKYEMSCGLANQLPQSTLPEVVFAGRSNVGKSSLINKIFTQKQLARVSATPGKTATISTTVYQLWRTNDDAGAFFWVMINLAISTVVLLTVNLLESKQKVRAKG